jgi:hypothetical protein
MSTRGTPNLMLLELPVPATECPTEYAAQVPDLRNAPLAARAPPLDFSRHARGLTRGRQLSYCSLSRLAASLAFMVSYSNPTLVCFSACLGYSGCTMLTSSIAAYFPSKRPSSGGVDVSRRNREVKNEVVRTRDLRRNRACSYIIEVARRQL